MRGQMWHSRIVGAAFVGITLWAPSIVQSHEGHGGPPGHAHNFLTADGQPGQGQAQGQQQQGSMERLQSGRPDTRQGSAQQPGMQHQQGSTGAPGSGGMAGGGGSQPRGGAGGGGMSGR